MFPNSLSSTRPSACCPVVSGSTYVTGSRHQALDDLWARPEWPYSILRPGLVASHTLFVGLGTPGHHTYIGTSGPMDLFP